MKRSLLAAFLVLLPGLAGAQPRPPTAPTRDVEVGYRVLGGPANAPRSFNVSVLSAEGLVRAEAPGMPGWVLAELRTGQSKLIVDALRAVTPAPVRQEEALRYLRLAERARLVPAGPGRHAGQDCTNYRWSEGGQSGTACLTRDGVLLRGTNERGEGVEAERVAYARQDPGRFRVPDGYRPVDTGDLSRLFGLGRRN